jgi:hypothetical protein
LFRKNRLRVVEERILELREGQRVWRTYLHLAPLLDVWGNEVVS